MTSEENDACDKIKWDQSSNALSFWEMEEGLKQRVLSSRKLGVFLDYDGTLTPIVSDPDKSFISEKMRNLIAKLSGQRDTNVAIVSGRCISKLQQFLKLTNLHLSGSHGAEILCPGTSRKPKGVKMTVTGNLDNLKSAKNDVQVKLNAYPGCQIEDNKFVFSIHFRNAKFQLLPRRQRRAKQRELETDLRVIAKKRDLRMEHGKKVFEMKPKGKWDKGAAVLWLIRQVMRREDAIGSIPYGDDTLSYDDREEDSSDGPERILSNEITSKVEDEDNIDQLVANTAPPFYFYLGDDQSDETAFAALKRNYPDRSLGILVAAKRRETAATCWLKDVDEVYQFLSLLLRRVETVAKPSTHHKEEEISGNSLNIPSSYSYSAKDDFLAKRVVAYDEEHQ